MVIVVLPLDSTIAPTFYSSYAGAVFELTPSNTSDLASVSIDQNDIGDVNGCLAFDDAGLNHASTASHVTFDQVDAFNEDALFLEVDVNHFASSTFVFTGHHENGVPFFDLVRHFLSSTELLVPTKRCG